MDRKLASGEGSGSSSGSGLTDADLVGASSMKNREERSLRLYELGRRAAAEGDAAAWNGYVRSLRPGRDQAAFVAGLAEGVSAGNLAVVEMFVSSLPSGLAKEVGYGMLAEKHAATAPLQGLDKARAWLSGPARNNSISAIAETWGQRDLPGLLRWAATSPSDPDLAQLVDMAAAGAAGANPQDALRVLANAAGALPESVVGEALQTLLGVWAIHDPEGALQAGIQLQREHGWTAPLSSAVLGWATENPAAAAGFVSQNPAMVDPASVAQVAKLFAEQAPVESSVWVATLDESAGYRHAAHAEVAEVWAKNNSPEALGWALSLPDNDRAKAESIRRAYLIWERFDAAGLERYLAGVDPPALEKVRRMVEELESGEF